MEQVKTRFSRTKKWMKSCVRSRNVYVFTFSIITVFLMFLVDPDNAFIQDLPWGAGVVATLVAQLRPVIAIVLLHFTRKALFDYIDLGDIYTLIMSEKKDPIAAALFMVGVSIFTFAFAIIIAVSML